MGVLLFKGGVGVGMLKWQTSDLSHCVEEESRVFPPSPTRRERGTQGGRAKNQAASARSKPK